jgi:hypothetical protein
MSKWRSDKKVGRLESSIPSYVDLAEAEHPKQAGDTRLKVALGLGLEGHRLVKPPR